MVKLNQVAPGSTWWDSFPRFADPDATANATKLPEIDALRSIDANLMIGTADEGRGPWARESDKSRTENNKFVLPAPAQYGNNKFLKSGVRQLAWMESMGDTRTFIIAINNRGTASNPSFELENDGSGAAKAYASNWSWDDFGPGKIPQSNYFVWAGMTSFVNNETWLGKFKIDNPEYGLSKPTYPDGRSVLGFNGDPQDPRNSRLIDANGGKSIYGKIEYFCDPYGKNETGKIIVIEGEERKACGDFGFSKDQGSLWWMDYNISAAKYFVNNGIDGFWLDNSSGWDHMRMYPTVLAFGDWSIRRFQDFLEKYPEISVGDTRNFNVATYLKDKFREKFEIETTDPYAWQWGHESWLTDPVWKAFLVSKSEMLGERARYFYSSVKDYLAQSGRDPDSIAITGNDVPSISYGAFTGAELDQVNTEYNPAWHVDSGPVGRGIAPRGYTGSFYAAAIEFARSRHSLIWFYLNGDEAIYRNKTNLGKVMGLEAFANNAYIKMPGTEKSIGNAEAAQFINKTILNTSEAFSGRTRAAQVGVLYSTQTQLSFLTPGGFYGFDFSDSLPERPGYLDHNLGYMGWASALENLGVSYRAVADFRLSVESLSALKVLVLPHVRVLDEALVTNALIPFLDRGGIIITTGNTGEFAGKSAFFSPHPQNLIQGLKNNGYGDRIIEVSGNPGFEFHRGRLIEESQRREQGLSQIQQVVNGLVERGAIAKDLECSNNCLDKIRLGVNEDRIKREKYFDLVNFQWNTNDSVERVPVLRLKLLLPDKTGAENFEAQIFNADEQAWSKVELRSAGEGFAELDSPAFSTYVSVRLIAKIKNIDSSEPEISSAQDKIYGVKSFAILYGKNLDANGDNVVVSDNCSQLIFKDFDKKNDQGMNQINLYILGEAAKRNCRVKVKRPDGKMSNEVSVAFNPLPDLGTPQLSRAWKDSNKTNRDYIYLDFDRFYLDDPRTIPVATCDGVKKERVEKKSENSGQMLISVPQGYSECWFGVRRYDGQTTPYVKVRF